MKKHFKWLLGLVAGLLSAGSLSAADYNIVTYKYCAPNACASVFERGGITARSRGGWWGGR